MNKITIVLLFILQTIHLYAQPGYIEGHVPKDLSALSQPYLHCVTDEKYFANYATEAHSGFFKLMEPFKCKLHIPQGLNKIWQDAEKSKLYNTGDYDYSKDFRVGIRFNFYVGGIRVSTALKYFEKSQLDTGSFIFYFELDPLDFEKGEGELNFAYIEFLKNIKKRGSQLVIEAALPSKHENQNSYVPIVCNSFYLQYDNATYEAWKKSSTNYNIRLKQLADSTMKRIFGETGFLTNFTMTCLQNPCLEGYSYANTLESTNPCASEPQYSCKEAIVSYRFVKKDVPLTIKMLTTIKESGEIVYIENNHFGSSPISIEKQNLLSISEIQKIFTKRFRKENLAIVADDKALVYSQSRIQQPKTRDEGNKLNKEPGYKLIKQTKAGKNWKNGFIYIARSKNPKTQNCVYHFDAVTGDLLWITEFYTITN